MTEYVVGWSYWRRVAGECETFTARDERDLRRQLRARWNVRSTRGFSIATRERHDVERAAYLRVHSEEEA